MAGCTSDPPPADPSPAGSSVGSPSTESTATDSASGVGTVELAGLKVDVAGSLTLTAAASEDPAPADQQLQQLAKDLGGHASTPVELTASEALPTTGAVLTHTYSAPLEAEATATFVYYDANTSLWTAVPSTLSPDRTTLTATVSHFSIWDDFVGNTAHAVGSFLNQRAKPPACTHKADNPKEFVLPSWLLDSGVTYLDDENAPLLWCAQADDNGNLLVKVAVNRGYGMVINASVPPDKSFLSYIGANAFDLNAMIATSSTYWTNFLTGNSQEVPAQQEADFTFTEAQVRAAPNGGAGLVHAEKPSLTQAAWGILFTLLEQYLPDDGLTAYLFELAALSTCGSNIITSIANAFAEIGAFTSCILAHQQDLANQISNVRLKLNPNATTRKEIADIGHKAGRLASRAASVFTIFTITQELGSYYVDLNAPETSYTFNVFTQPVKPAVAEVTDTLLLSAPVPALRGNPAGNLVNGSLPNPFASGSVELVQSGGGAPAHGDLNGDGVKDAAATIDATSGAGGLDQYVELYTNGNDRFAEWDMAAAVHADHAFVTAMLIRDGDVLVDGSAEHLPNGPETYWSARLHWDGQQLNADVQDGNTGITNSGLWSDSKLVITPTSLGAVRIGMTLSEVNAASGVNVDISGDGVYDSTQMPPDSLHLYIQGQTVSCVGAGTRPSATQQVATKEGVAVGDPVSKVLSTYPQATFVPPPADGGRTINAGYVISSSDGDLAFIVDSANTTITAITGGRGLTPNSCAG